MARTAREVLNRLKWGKGPGILDAKIWVFDRMWPEGSRMISGEEIVSLGRRYFATATATIPYYKIRLIEAKGEVLFERAPSGRIDGAATLDR